MNVLAEREQFAHAMKNGEWLFHTLLGRLAVNLYAERYDAAADAETDMLEYIQDARPSTDQSLAVSICRGQLAWALGNVTDAKQHVDHALQFIDDSTIAHRVSTLYGLAARVAYAQGDLKASTNYQGAALKHAMDTWPTTSAHTIDETISYCSHRMELNELAGVEELLQDALERTLGSSGAGSARHGQVLAALGRYATCCGDSTRARTLLEEADQVLSPLGSTGTLADVNYHLAQAYVFLGLHESALSRAHRAVKIDTEVYGDDSTEVAKDLHNLAEVQAATGRPKTASQTIRRAVEIFEAHPEYPGHWQELARRFQRQIRNVY
ncbi:MAG: tetratricopeptide repeat protein [Pseudonocardiaceae bacterium]|nr:tetratricopeptide repeat protein [Pseudonocardiaceae bacterium]